jgi:glycosyltransferase involved in cell wall biosynthesis
VITFPLAVAELSSPIFFKPRLSVLKTTRLLFLGRIHPVNALPNIFKAIRSLHDRGQDVELNIAGDGDSSYVLALKKMAINEGVADRIYWHGQVDAQGRDRLFAKVNIFVMASYHENFGLAAAEAMASGLPVVLSDQVGLAKDVIEFNAGLIVPCDDPEAIANSIQGLMRAEKWLVHSKGAQDLVRNKYGVKTFAKSLLSMYKKACI